MEPIAWQPLWSMDEADLAIGYPWYFATDITGEWAWLRFIAEGLSACLGPAVTPCGVNGHASLQVAADRLIVAGAAPGVLLGKFGGSSASRNDGTPFVIGSRCVIAMPEKKKSQLYFGINGAVPDGANVMTRLRVTISAVAPDPA